MAIEWEESRASQRCSRGARTSRTTIREVCVIGMVPQARVEAWATGQTITWLGRGYRVVATAASPPERVDAAGSSRAGRGSPGTRRDAAEERHYVHLAPCEGG
jgi:hypothetical protein